MDKIPQSGSEAPLTPAVFHILLSLSQGERHGYGIMLDVAEQTGGTMKMGPGTLYGTIKRLLAARLIEEVGERVDHTLGDERRRYYRLTDFGELAVRSEARRLEVLVEAARERRLLPSGGSG
jgi:DNA-binding PadR family transcriptional regulator